MTSRSQVPLAKRSVAFRLVRGLIFAMAAAYLLIVLALWYYFSRTLQGKAMLAYRFDETIDLAEESMLAHGKQEPIVRSVMIPKGGTAIPTVDYVDASCKIKILGLWGDGKGSPEQADVSVVFESKSVDTSSLNLGKGVTPPIIIHFESEKSLRAANGFNVGEAAAHFGGGGFARLSTGGSACHAISVRADPGR